MQCFVIGNLHLPSGQRLEFHHAMDRQGNRGDMFAPYLEMESRKAVPMPEKASRPLEKDPLKREEKYFDYPAMPGPSADTFRAGATLAWLAEVPGHGAGIHRVFCPLISH